MPQLFKAVSLTIFLRVFHGPLDRSFSVLIATEAVTLCLVTTWMYSQSTLHYRCKIWRKNGPYTCSQAQSVDNHLFLSLVLFLSFHRFSLSYFLYLHTPFVFCLLRLQDIDEFIIPHKHLRWRDMILEAETRNLKISNKNKRPEPISEV